MSYTMDYLVAVSIGLVGITIMYFIFKSISSADIQQATAKTTAATRKLRSKKTHTTRKNKEDVLDGDTDALIAREIARNPSGMSRDFKMQSHPETLDAIRNRKKGRHSTKTMHAEFSERQRQIDRELGFVAVDSTPRTKAERVVRAAESTKTLTENDDEMERKLSAFFQNARKGRGIYNATSFTPEEGLHTGTGGRVVVKRIVSNARTW